MVRKLTPIEIREALQKYAAEKYGLVGTPGVELIATWNIDVPQGCEVDLTETVCMVNADA